MATAPSGTTSTPTNAPATTTAQAVAPTAGPSSSPLGAPAAATPPLVVVPAGYIRIGRTYSDKCVVPAPNDPIPVQTMRLTDYLRGVLPNEWNAAWPAASLDAGAIAVKAYAWYNAVIQPKWSTKGYAFDLLDNTCDQYYRDNSADPRTDAALARTWYTWVTRNGLLVPLEYRALETQCPALPGCMGQVQSAQFAGMGANAEAILRHYYAGIDVVRVPPPRPIYLPLVTR